MATSDATINDSTLPAGEFAEEANTLRDISRIKYQKAKLHESHLCPVCGTDDTEEFHYERLCNNDNCDVLSYISTT